MANKSIYPSIPDPGSSIGTIVPCLLAMKQTLQMIILNAQVPNPNYAPSSAAQIFVTNERLKILGVKGALPSIEDSLVALQQQIDELEARIGS
jgi:hypothetical protein